METFYCAQRGCVFEAEDEPAECLVCGNPFIPHPDQAPAVEVSEGEGE